MPGIDEQENTNYDIVAIAPEGTAPTRDEFRRMLQTLFVDRFQLKAHTQKRQMPVYALVVGKGRPKLSPSEPAHGLHGVNGRNQLVEAAITMNDLANDLWDDFISDRPAIDHVGLTGTYKLRIEATPEYRSTATRSPVASASSPLSRGSSASNSNPPPPRPESSPSAPPKSPQRTSG